MRASRSFFRVLLFSIVLVSWGTGFASQTFVEKCLENTEILNKPLTCETADIKYTLHLGTTISVVAGKAKVVNMPVRKIVHLPARIESMGVVGESIKFVAANHGGVVATVNILCGQDKYGFVGIASHAQIPPSETVAQCHY